MSTQFSEIQHENPFNQKGAGNVKHIIIIYGTTRHNLAAFFSFNTLRKFENLFLAIFGRQNGVRKNTRSSTSQNVAVIKKAEKNTLTCLGRDPK